MAMRLRVPAALAFLLLAAGTSSAQVPGPTWEQLQAQGAVIAGIDISVTDVFDPADPADDHWFGRAADAIHVQTRTSVVARELLFAVGDTVDAGRIHETERKLRAYSFIRDAHIVADGVSGNTVRAHVLVHDAWSLRGDVGFSHTGGNTTWRARIDEGNLLGFGKRLILSHQSDPERTTDEIGYVDPQLFGTHAVLAADYATLSDGKARLIAAELPHYSIESRYAFGVGVGANESVLTLYNHGEAVFAYPGRHESANAYASWAFAVRDRTAFRVGLSLRARQDEYGDPVTYQPGWLPAPDTSTRRFRGWMASWSMLQDRHATFRNLAGIGHTEDYNLGWVVAGGVGYYATSLGSLNSASFGEAVASRGWRNGANSLALLNTWWRGRREADGWHDSIARASLTLYNASLPGQTLAANVDVFAAVRPDPVNALYLDGSSGLRGYVDHFLAGDRRVMFSAEDRVITGWSLLGLVRVGFVGYVDVGAVHRFDTGAWSRTYADAGGGLRLGSLKSARGNSVQLTVAVPLVREPGMDHFVLVLGNSVRF